jgi:hypothetical protein
MGEHGSEKVERMPIGGAVREIVVFDGIEDSQRLG